MFLWTRTQIICCKHQHLFQTDSSVILLQDNNVVTLYPARWLQYYYTEHHSFTLLKCRYYGTCLPPSQFVRQQQHANWKFSFFRKLFFFRADGWKISKVPEKLQKDLLISYSPPLNLTKTKTSWRCSSRVKRQELSIYHLLHLRTTIPPEESCIRALSC